MADEDKVDENSEEAKKAEVNTNPDLEKETEGMVDLSDVLATGDNETGAADAGDALADQEKNAKEEVDLFSGKATSEKLEENIRLGFFDKLMLKIFPESSRQKIVVDKITDFLLNTFTQSKKFLLSFKENSQKFLKEDLKKILGILLAKLKVFGGVFLKEIKDFLSLKWRAKSFFILACMFGIISFVAFQKSMDGELIPGAQKVYILNFNEVADKVYKIEESAGWEKFRNPLRFPEYVVRFDRLIVMLKKSQFSSSSPMGVFALYFETSSQEAATELKYRESEVRDFSARTLEGFTYDDIRSFEGKKKAKKALIKSLNKILNQGNVVNIYFKDFVLKP